MADSVPKGTTPTPVEDPKVDTTTKVEAPYTEYQSENKNSYVAKRYDLGDTWNDPAGFKPEIDTIEGFFTHQINRGKLDNTVKAVEAKIKEYERMAGVEPTDRIVMKVGKLAEYIKFLRATENLEKYGPEYIA